MSKFIIECPVCHSFAEARTGFFASRKINCACGNVINIRTDKIVSKVCPSCHNTVVYDQSRGRDAKCPVCKAPLVTTESMSNTAVFHCRTCGCTLQTDKAAEKYTCPVCDTENDVQERLVSERIREEGLVSVIKYEGDNSTFIWKHPIEDFNYGSQLIVHESQEAIFFRDGQALDLFGPGRYTLETQQLPLLEKIYRLPVGGQESVFHSEVYFINKTVQMAIKWGTPEKVRFIDPLTGTPLQLGASGEMNVQVSDSRRLLVKLVGTMKGISWEEGPGLTKSLQASFRPLITNAVKTNLPAAIKDEAIDLLEIDERLDILSARLRDAILPGFEEYGLTVPQLYVTNVVLPEEDPNFKRIRELHTITLQTRMYQAEATVKAAQAQSETLYRTAQEQSRAAIEAAHREAELEKQTTETEITRRAAERKVIEAQAEAQAQRMAGLTEAEIMQAKGYTQRDVLQAEVQKSYAEGIGNMGPAISTGGGSGIMGDMLGLGVGMAAASAIAPQLGGMMQGMSFGNQQNGQQAQQPQQPQQSIGQAINAPLQMNQQTYGASSASDTWDCDCGQKGIIGNFCNNCGVRRPEAKKPDTWDCACGQKGIIGNFCNNCGARRLEQRRPDTWDCACGQKGIIGNFCNNCGKKRGE